MLKWEIEIMAKQRTSFTAEQKMLAVIEALQTKLTLAELAQKHQTSIRNIINWKQQFLENAHLAFDTSTPKDSIGMLKQKNAKLEKILEKTMEQRDEAILKLKPLDISIKKQMIDTTTSELSIVQQCKIIDLNRPSLYYEPKPSKKNDDLIMQRICEIVKETTSYCGYRMMHQHLLNEGFKIGINKVHKLMKLLEEKGELKQKNTLDATNDTAKYSHALHNLELLKPLKL